MKIDIKTLLKDAIKELPDDASREQVLAYVDAAIAKAEAIEGKPEEVEAPAVEEVVPMADAPTEPPKVEEPAKMSAPAPDVAATCAPPAAAPAVSAADAPAPPAAAVDAEAASVVALVAEALGKPLVEALSLMRDRAADVAAMLGGTPDSGMPAESAALSSANASLRLSLSVANAATAARDKMLADQATELAALRAKVDAARVDGLGREIDESIRCGHFLPADKPLLLSLAKSDEGALREHLTRAASAPKVPTGRVAASATVGDERTVGEASVDEDDRKLRLSLLAAGLSPEKVDAHMKSRSKQTTKINGRA